MQAETALVWSDPVFPHPRQPETCPICGEVFYPGAIRQRLCSAACRRHAYLKRMRAARIGASEPCLRCGDPFIRKQREESPFCGTFCKWIFEKQTPVDEPDTVDDVLDVAADAPALPLRFVEHPVLGLPSHASPDHHRAISWRFGHHIRSCFKFANRGNPRVIHSAVPPTSSAACVATAPTRQQP